MTNHLNFNAINCLNILFFITVTHYVISQNSNDSASILISDYIILKEGKTNIYYSLYNNNRTNQKSTRTDTIVQTTLPSNTSAIYFKNKSLPFLEGYINYFIEGAIINQNDSIFYSPLSSNNDLVRDLNFQLLFPRKIALFTYYEGVGAFGEKLSYYINGFDSLTIENTTYRNCIRLTKTRQGKYQNDIDFIWIAKGIGVVKWEKSTGRLSILKESSVEKSISIDIEKEKKDYKNKEGIFESRSSLEKIGLNNGTFSKAVYNTKGLLEQEIFFGASGELMVDSVYYKYNDQGVLIEEIFYQKIPLNSNMTQIGKKLFKYKKNGQLKALVIIFSDGRKIRTRVTKNKPNSNRDVRFSTIHKLKRPIN